MAQYIDKSALVAEIERKYETNLIGAHSAFRNGKIEALREVKDFLNTLETKEIDLKKESEIIANGIMIAVQENKYHTCIYNPERCDFNHSHLWLAARKGIELGLKTKGEKL